jgi:lipopolysaccharide/colanic/teichoic acid biosynthesis glycosyltransferase
LADSSKAGEEYKGWHNERLEVLPGITGLAQVQGRSGINFDSIVKYDKAHRWHKRTFSLVEPVSQNVRRGIWS